MRVGGGYKSSSAAAVTGGGRAAADGSGGVGGRTVAVDGGAASGAASGSGGSGGSGRELQQLEILKILAAAAAAAATGGGRRKKPPTAPLATAADSVGGGREELEPAAGPWASRPEAAAVHGKRAGPAGWSQQQQLAPADQLLLTNQLQLLLMERQLRAQQQASGTTAGGGGDGLGIPRQGGLMWSSAAATAPSNGASVDGRRPAAARASAACSDEAAGSAAGYRARLAAGGGMGGGFGISSSLLSLAVAQRQQWLQGQRQQQQQEGATAGITGVYNNTNGIKQEAVDRSEWAADIAAAASTTYGGGASSLIRTVTQQHPRSALRCDSWHEPAAAAPIVAAGAPRQQQATCGRPHVPPWPQQLSGWKEGDEAGMEHQLATAGPLLPVASYASSDLAPGLIPTAQELAGLETGGDVLPLQQALWPPPLPPSHASTAAAAACKGGADSGTNGGGGRQLQAATVLAALLGAGLSAGRWDLERQGPLALPRHVNRRQDTERADAADGGGGSGSAIPPGPGLGPPGPLRGGRLGLADLGPADTSAALESDLLRLLGLQQQPRPWLKLDPESAPAAFPRSGPAGVHGRARAPVLNLSRDLVLFGRDSAAPLPAAADGDSGLRDRSGGGGRNCCGSNPTAPSVQPKGEPCRGRSTVPSRSAGVVPGARPPPPLPFGTVPASAEPSTRGQLGATMLELLLAAPPQQAGNAANPRAETRGLGELLVTRGHFEAGGRAGTTGPPLQAKAPSDTKRGASAAAAAAAAGAALFDGSGAGAGAAAATTSTAAARCDGGRDGGGSGGDCRGRCGSDSGGEEAARRRESEGRSGDAIEGGCDVQDGGPVKVCCRPRNFSRYLTLAEVEALLGATVMRRLYGGGRLLDVRVRFHLGGRTLPEVHSATIERYSSASPCYVKAATGRGQDGLPWRLFEAGGAVQWRRMADDTLVMAQVSKSCKRSRAGAVATAAAKRPRLAWGSTRGGGGGRRQKAAKRRRSVTPETSDDGSDSEPPPSDGDGGDAEEAEAGGQEGSAARAREGLISASPRALQALPPPRTAGAAGLWAVQPAGCQQSGEECAAAGAAASVSVDTDTTPGAGWG